MSSKPPGYLQQYHFALASSATPPFTSCGYPLSHTLSYDHLSPKHKHFSLAISSVSEPQTFQEAMVHDC